MPQASHQKILDRIVWRGRLKTLLQFSGILLICAGAMFIPLGRGQRPKSTVFRQIVDFGTFGKSALVLIGAGATVVAASWLIRGGLYDPDR